jgi:hypothetical protein
VMLVRATLQFMPKYHLDRMYTKLWSCNRRNTPTNHNRVWKFSATRPIGKVYAAHGFFRQPCAIGASVHKYSRSSGEKRVCLPQKKYCSSLLQMAAVFQMASKGQFLNIDTHRSSVARDGTSRPSSVPREQCCNATLFGYGSAWHDPADPP